MLEHHDWISKNLITVTLFSDTESECTEGGTLDRVQDRTVGTALASSSPNNGLFELFVFLHCSHKVSRQDGRHTWPLLSRSFSNLLGILCAPELHRPCRDKNTNLTEDIYDIYSRKNFDSGYIEGFAKLPYFRSLFIVATSM